MKVEGGLEYFKFFILEEDLGRKSGVCSKVNKKLNEREQS